MSNTDPNRWFWQSGSINVPGGPQPLGSGGVVLDDNQTPGTQRLSSAHATASLTMPQINRLRRNRSQLCTLGVACCGRILRQGWRQLAMLHE